MKFQKATKSKAKARVALYGPAGSGKTYTSLAVATGLCAPDKRVAVIDTEHGSASKYADRFDFDALNLTDHRMEAYMEAMHAAAEEGYGVIVIDSISHGWQKMLEEVDLSAKASRTGNSFAAWRDHTPRQKRFVEAILSSPCHLIATIRAQTEWVQETNERGKTAPRRLGLKPEQGKGIEYEFDLLIQLSAEHLATIEKDRSGKFQDSIIDKPGRKFGEELAAWLSDGTDAPTPTPVVERPRLNRNAALARVRSEVERVLGIDCGATDFSNAAQRLVREMGYQGSVRDMGDDELGSLLDKLSSRPAGEAVLNGTAGTAAK